MEDFHDKLVALLPRLRRFAIGLTGNVSDGDDLLQSAIERALKSQASFRPELSFNSWMFKITQNLWIDQKRSEARRGTSIDIEETYDLVGEDGRTKMEQRHMTQKVLHAINELPEAQRLAVSYVLVDGRTYKEAASVLGVPVGTVMSRLARARKILMDQLLGADAGQGALS